MPPVADAEEYGDLVDDSADGELVRQIGTMVDSGEVCRGSIDLGHHAATRALGTAIVGRFVSNGGDLRFELRRVGQVLMRLSGIGCIERLSITGGEGGLIPSQSVEVLARRSCERVGRVFLQKQQSSDWASAKSLSAMAATAAT